MYLKFLIWCSLLFVSCNHSKTNIIKDIAGEKYKYWTVVDSGSARNAKILYFFDDAGNWDIYTRFPDGKIVAVESDDVILLKKWKYISDTSINIGGRVYKIEILNQQEFIYSYEGKVFKRLIATPDGLLKKSDKR